MGHIGHKLPEVAESYIEVHCYGSIHITCSLTGILFIGTDPKSAFALLRKYQRNGPLVNSEYYTGWLDLWGIQHQTRDPNKVANTLDKILAMNASVNMYMFEGGTTFGYMNGKYFNSYVNGSSCQW